MLSLGGLGIQYCIKSQKAFDNLIEIKEDIIPVQFSEYNEKYNERDIAAREKMKRLIDSDRNQVTKVFSLLF